MLANCPKQFQLSLAVSELVWYSSCYVHVTIRHITPLLEKVCPQACLLVPIIIQAVVVVYSPFLLRYPFVQLAWRPREI
jgi:hypothetical protein